MDPIVAETVAREARKRDAKERFRGAKDRLEQAGEMSNLVQRLASKAMSDLSSAQAALTAAEAEGPGITDDFGSYSTLEQRMRVERFAGKAATIDYIKANPACALDDALLAYEAAALAACPEDERFLIQDPNGLFAKYAKDAVALGVIPDTTWGSFRALVIASDKTLLMGM